MKEIITHRCGAGMSEAIRIEYADDPSPDGVHYKYQLYKKMASGWEKLCRIDFQPGPLKDNVPSGLSVPSVLAVLIDFLTAATAKAPVREDVLALEDLERAMALLQMGTLRAKAAGVETFK